MSRSSAEPSSSLQTLVTQPQLVDTSKYYCPFLDRGICRGLYCCNFSHDYQESTKIPIDYCHFYLANQCLSGQDCKFIHSEPNEDEQLLANNFATISFQGSNNSAGEGDCDEDEEDNDTNHDYDDDDDDVYHSLDGDGEGRQGLTNNNNDDNINGSIRNDERPVRRFIGFKRLGREQAEDLSRQPPHQQRREPNQGPSSRLRATISHRCTTNANAANATSTPKPPQESAQSSSHMNTTTPSGSNTSIKSSSSSSTSKPPAKTWQGARLIASIRNNNLASQEAEQQHQCSSKGLSGDTGGSADDYGVRDLPLCPYSLASGECPFPYGHCSYIHGEVCDLCYSPCLHPFNETQRRQHREECLREHEREMELSFAVQRSKDKVCGICMDTVVEKKPVISSRFGILEKCNHIFCLDCIRKWRSTKQFDNRTIRACPECRVSSDFVVPSKYWVEDQADKDKLINDYKSALRARPCKYFNQGKGECPFAGSCFYRHAYPDGRLAVLEAPKPRRRHHGTRFMSSNVANYIFWNFMSTMEDEMSEDGPESLYAWEMASIDDDDDDLEYGYDI